MYLPCHKSRVLKLSGGQSVAGKVYTPALEEMGNYRHLNAFTIQYFLVALDCNRVQKKKKKRSLFDVFFLLGAESQYRTHPDTEISAQRFTTLEGHKRVGVSLPVGDKDNKLQVFLQI